MTREETLAGVVAVLFFAGILLLTVFAASLPSPPPEMQPEEHGEKKRSGLMIGPKGIGIEVAPGVGIGVDGQLQFGIGI